MSMEIEPFKDTLGSPDVLNTAHKLASQINGTDFVPKAFRGKPEAVMAALLTGRELGLGPMTALQRIHVIEGKAGLDAQGMRAQVLAAGHDLWIDESTPERCTVSGQRRGSQHVQSVTWTIQEARTAGLANKQVWKSYPRQMLQARATAELCRLIAPDALGGLAYSSEELADQQPATVRRADRQQRPSEAAEDVVRITTAPAPVAASQNDPAPAWDDDVTEAEIVEEQPARRGVTHNWDRPTTDDTAPATEETGELVTDKQVRMLSALFTGRGMDEDEIDALILEASSSRTTSRKELTRTEASTLIDQLKQATA